MQPLDFVLAGEGPCRILCLGAHCDDIELGCGGTLLDLLGRRAVSVHWVVFSSNERRAREARASAARFLDGAQHSDLAIETFRNGYFPTVLADVKDYFEQLKSRVDPHVIFTHYRDDRHQDHRVISDLTWNTFRNHLILEYEIMKYDGDLGAPNVFVELDDEVRQRKVRYIEEAYESQRDKQWFDADTFNALMRLRGTEVNATSRYAEAFYARKLALGIARS